MIICSDLDLQILKQTILNYDNSLKNGLLI
jgi:hypothetical protein